MNGIILLIVALGALGAFSAGVVLLILYFRAGRGKVGGNEPIVYGNLVQCPRCGYMNPIDSPACLNCRHTLPRTQANYQPPPPAPTYAPDYTPYRPPSAPIPSPTYTPSPAPLRPSGVNTFGPPSQVTSPAPSGAPPTSAAPVPPPVPQVTVPAPAAIPTAPSPASQAAQAGAPSGDLPKAWLEGVAGVMMGHTAALEKSDMMVGRSTSCDIQVYDPKVSRRHFMIRFANGAFFLQDQQSSRGTSINGERVMAQRLHDGDRIEVGDTTLVFHVE